jgi:hypothetical protein
VFAFSSLWFSHYCLAALERLRAEPVAAPVAVASPAPDASAGPAPLGSADDRNFPAP